MRYFMKKTSVFYIQKEAWEDSQEYKESYKNVIKQRENHRIPFMHQSPQIMYRPYLVEYLKKLCIEKKLSHCTLHLAVYILDIFMDNHSIVPERLQLLTNNCLLLAAKFEENSVNIPKIVDLNMIINNRYCLKDYKDLELVILRFFDWYVMFPTAAHYTHYYIQEMISEEDYDEYKLNGGIRTLFYNLHEGITQYLDRIIENIHYMQAFSPSKLAATIIAASRFEQGLSTWTEQLEILTGFKLDDLQELLKIFLKQKDFNCFICGIKN